MADLSRSVRGRRRPRNPGQLDLVTKKSDFDNYTTSLLKFNGTDGSAVFTDEIGSIWTAGGNAQLDTAQKRFETASALFDGTGDYILGDGSGNFVFGTGDFTIDFWIRFNTIPATLISIYDHRPASGSGPYPLFYYDNVSGKLKYHDGVTDRITSTTTPIVLIWYHIALTKSGTSLKLFINGIQEGSTYTDSNNYGLGALRPAIGIHGPTLSSYPFNGWIDEYRVSLGIARWTANFTPPGYSYNGLNLIDDAFTTSLLHFNGADATINFFDEGGPCWSRVGVTQIDTAQSKFGGSSLLFNGTTDLLYTNNNYTNFTFGTGDFTIDFWVRLASITPLQIIYDSRAPSPIGGYPVVYYDNVSGKFIFYNNATLMTGTTTVAANTWYHIAVTRAGTVTKLFVNGVQEAINNSDSSNYLVGTLRPILGVAGTTGNSYYFGGWIDELRVSKGIARWTANFTPPTAEYAPPP